MKSCCSACKKGKPCGSDMSPQALGGIFKRRSIGYGVYGDEVPAPVAAVAAPAPPPPPSFIDQNKQTIIYLVAALALYKILF